MATNGRLTEAPDRPVTVDLGDNPFSLPDIEDGALKTENADGSATIDFSPKPANKEGPNRGWFENLADDIEEDELSRIANDLLTGIDSDNQSRNEWMEMRTKGLTLLGLKIEDPKTDVSTSSAAAEGMSTIRHPLLLDSVLRFQANARGELLPASGPVKVRNDTPSKPKSAEAPPMPPPMPPPAPPPGIGHNGGPPMAGAPPAPMPGPPGGGAPLPAGMPPGGTGVPPPIPSPQVGGPPGAMPPPMPMPPMPLGPPPETANDVEELAAALELDMNHYLTAVATEYYPDTDRMLFYIGFGGQGFKKVYNCPIKQRPVSESVDAEDLIVSNNATDLANCGRITHRIKMRPSILKRMQIVEAYRNIDINPAPQFAVKDPVEQKKDDIQGVRPQIQLPDDAEHEIYECYCELNIKGFEHKLKGKESGLRCPYKVTIHKESRRILEVRRAWKEDDKLCMPIEYFVEFPFVRAIGFYAIGLVHIAGNTTNTLTAAWREMLDAGMFANFPGFIYNKMFGRQLTNQFRVPPGGGLPLDLGNIPINQAVMPLPYKEPGPAFTSFIQHVEEVGQRVAGSAEINIGEGTQDVPVGTTMAVIEQATKVMDAVHKRLHAAQAQEFKLLKDRFKEDPESFWRHNKKPTVPWQKEQFLKALEDFNIVPVADPNNPTSLHRIAKATAIKTLQQANPAIYDAVAVDKRIYRIVGIDPEGLFNQNPTAAPPDPKIIAVQQKAQTDQAMGQIKMAELALKAEIAKQSTIDKAADREARERLEHLKIQLEGLKIIEEQIIHHGELNSEDQSANQTTLLQYQMHADKLVSDIAKHRMSIDQQKEAKGADIAAKMYDTDAKVRIAKERPKPTGGK